MTSLRLNRRALFQDLGYQPHPGQWEVHRSPALRRVVACGVRWGKSVAAAMEGIAAALEPAERSIGWIVAPTYDLSDRVFREVQIIATQHLRHRIVALKEAERRLLLRNMGAGISEIRAKSADNPISLLGEGLNWVVVDEAARLKPSIWEAHLSQRLIDKRGWAFLISTPRGKGWFYEMFRRGQPGGDEEFESWNQPSRNNPHLNAERIEAERARLPERVFREQYEAEFLEGSGQVFRNIRECATGEWLPPVPMRSYWAGLDLAKVEDYTVLVVMDRDRRVVAADRFHKLDWSLQRGRIQTLAHRYHDARILCDTTGVGEPIFEALRAGGCCVHPYPFTQKSKAALIDNLALLLEQRQLLLPRPDLWPEGVDELESFEYSITDNGSVRTGAPSGTHDDCVIGLALAAWSLRPNRPVPRLVVIGRRRPVTLRERMRQVAARTVGHL